MSESESLVLGMGILRAEQAGVRVRVVIEFEGALVAEAFVSPMTAGLFALETQEAARGAAVQLRRSEQRDRQPRGSTTTEAAPIGLPPLPPSGPSSTEVVEARPDEVEAEKNPNTTPTKRRRKR